MSNIGVTIGNLRRARHLTQRELGSRVSVSQSCISRIETGIRDPISERHLVSIAAALGVDTLQAASVPPTRTRVLNFIKNINIWRRGE